MMMLMMKKQLDAGSLLINHVLTSTLVIKQALQGYFASKRYYPIFMDGE